jgi:hypothetical protein
MKNKFKGIRINDEEIEKINKFEASKIIDKTIKSWNSDSHDEDEDDLLYR